MQNLFLSWRHGSCIWKFKNEPPAPIRMLCWSLLTLFWLSSLLATSSGAPVLRIQTGLTTRMRTGWALRRPRIHGIQTEHFEVAWKAARKCAASHADVSQNRSSVAWRCWNVQESTLALFHPSVWTSLVAPHLSRKWKTILHLGKSDDYDETRLPWLKSLVWLNIQATASRFFQQFLMEQALSQKMTNCNPIKPVSRMLSPKWCPLMPSVNTM